MCSNDRMHKGEVIWPTNESETLEVLIPTEAFLSHMQNVMLESIMDVSAENQRTLGGENSVPYTGRIIRIFPRHPTIEPPLCTTTGSEFALAQTPSPFCFTLLNLNSI